MPPRASMKVIYVDHTELGFSCWMTSFSCCYVKNWATVILIRLCPHMTYFHLCAIITDSAYSYTLKASMNCGNKLNVISPEKFHSLVVNIIKIFYLLIYSCLEDFHSSLIIIAACAIIFNGVRSWRWDFLLLRFHLFRIAKNSKINYILQSSLRCCSKITCKHRQSPYWPTKGGSSDVKYCLIKGGSSAWWNILYIAKRSHRSSDDFGKCCGCHDILELTRKYQTGNFNMINMQISTVWECLIQFITQWHFWPFHNCKFDLNVALIKKQL